MNYARTALLLAALTGLFLGMGYLLGGAGGMVIAFFVALAGNAFAYWNADKIVLRMYNAQPVDACSAPDLVRLVLFRADPELQGADWLIAQRDGIKGMPAFAEFMQRNEPLCGRLQPEKLDVLFGAHSAEVRSAVLVPIYGTGMLAIGSHDTQRFHPGMGTVFLKLIAEAAAAAIARFPAA